MNARLQAAAAGLKTYQTGYACRRGHTGPRYTSNGMCVECLQVHSQKFKDAARARADIKAREKAHEIVRHNISIPLQYSNSGIVQFIERILNEPDADGIITWFKHVATQPLDATVLVPMFDWRNNKVNIDPATYPMRNADDGRLLIQLRNAWYIGDEVMECLRGQRSHIERVWE